MPESITAGREIEISQPSGVVKRKPKIGAGRLDRAARELGMITVSSAKMRNLSVVGRFLDQVGILELSNGKLLGNAESLERGALRCELLANDDRLPAELRATFLELKLRFIRATNDNIQQMVELNGISQAKRNEPQATATKPFLVGAQVSPIQINIGSQNPQPAEKPLETQCKT